MKDTLRQNWDVPLLLIVFAALIAYSFTLEQIAREFTLVFLVMGFVFLSIELAAYLAPDKYTRIFKSLTSGLASEMDTESLGESAAGGEDVEDVPVEQGRTRFFPEELVDAATEQLILTSALLIGFIVVAYLFSFLFAVPLFVFGVSFLIGSRNHLNALLTAIVLTLAVYGLFGELLNVPILEGALVNWEELLREGL